MWEIHFEFYFGYCMAARPAIKNIFVYVISIFVALFESLVLFVRFFFFFLFFFGICILGGEIFSFFFFLHFIWILLCCFWFFAYMIFLVREYLVSWKFNLGLHSEVFLTFSVRRFCLVLGDGLLNYDFLCELDIFFEWYSECGARWFLIFSLTKYSLINVSRKFFFPYWCDHWSFIVHHMYTVLHVLWQILTFIVIVLIHFISMKLTIDYYFYGFYFVM